MDVKSHRLQSNNSTSSMEQVTMCHSGDDPYITHYIYRRELESWGLTRKRIRKAMCDPGSAQLNFGDCYFFMSNVLNIVCMWFLVRQYYSRKQWLDERRTEKELVSTIGLANHTGVSLLFTTKRSLNKSCDIPILEAAVRQVTPSL